ncbi:hypothetical protein U3A58_21410 [Algoriphagus sp. C2-6-M1]|uniref:hypothetical protein n=1 Tax=Algoriphagus persicinus TaxID=3108754 RepID=UPI002B3ECC8E|nr:hypothetical protein [Algoriphagus sp. C2-6-M1]MEB2782951.1 hypothetical protein [Algoriphagus sp. C2-6-M1]
MLFEFFHPHGVYTPIRRTDLQKEFEKLIPRRKDRILGMLLKSFRLVMFLGRLIGFGNGYRSPWENDQNGEINGVIVNEKHQRLLKWIR